MSKAVIANAFSLNMLSGKEMVYFEPVTEDYIKSMVSGMEVYSIVGHAATAALISAKLGVEVPYNRENYKLKKRDLMFVCLPNQRLEEGKVLSEEELKKIDMRFWLVQV